MSKKKIHKFVECEDNFNAEIFCEYDSGTLEVLDEWVVFSNSKVDYTSQSLEKEKIEEGEKDENENSS